MHTRIGSQALSGGGSAVDTLQWPRHWLGSGPCPCSSQPCTEEPRCSEWLRPGRRAKARRIGRELSGRLGLHQLSRVRAGTAPGRHTAPSTGGQGLRGRERAALPSQGRSAQLRGGVSRHGMWNEACTVPNRPRFSEQDCGATPVLCSAHSCSLRTMSPPRSSVRAHHIMCKAESSG
jgi:hypothetical protein